MSCLVKLHSVCEEDNVKNECADVHSVQERGKHIWLIFQVLGRSGLMVWVSTKLRAMFCSPSSIPRGSTEIAPKLECIIWTKFSPNRQDFALDSVRAYFLLLCSKRLLHRTRLLCSVAPSAPRCSLTSFARGGSLCSSQGLKNFSLWSFALCTGSAS